MRGRSALVGLAGVVVVLAVLTLRRVHTGVSTGESSAPVPDFSGVWVGKVLQSYNPSDPQGNNLEDGTPYQPWALKKLKSERPGTGPNGTFSTTDPALKYNDPDGYPRVLLHPFKFKIVQTRDYIYELFQYQQNWRSISLNRPHPADPDPSWFGEAVGQFEGNTLVVDSVGFNDKTWLDPVGRPHTDALHLVERFQRIDHDTLRDEITFDDPKAYLKPWSGEITFNWTSQRYGRRIFDTIGRTPLSERRH